MTKKRVIETNEGIQSPLVIEVFDEFARTMRDKGWNNVDSFVKTGIVSGNVLEIGPGPGYIGLEWLKKAPEAKLTVCEISDNMIKVAMKNARDYGFEQRVTYVQGNCLAMPFEADRFDGVITNGSLHEWEDPLKAFNEIYRVLKPGTSFCVTDMRRDVSPIKKWMIYFSTKPKEIRPGFLSSLDAAYMVNELQQILEQCNFTAFTIEKAFFGLCVSGIK